MGEVLLIEGAGRRRARVWFEQAPRLVADLNPEILRDALGERGAHTTDVIAVAYGRDINVAKHDCSIVRRGRGGEGEVEGIAESDAGVEDVERAAPAESRADAKAAVIAVDAGSLEIGELATRGAASTNIVAAVLGKELRGNDALQGFEAHLEFRGASARRAPWIRDQQDGGESAASDHAGFGMDLYHCRQMKFLSLKLLLVCVCLAQDPLGTGIGHSHPPIPDVDEKLAKSQKEAIVKADHKKNLDDATALLKLADDLKADLEKQDPYVISVKNIKQTEDIEKLAKNIHGRLNRY